MDRRHINEILERMNCLERMKNKYEDRSTDLYQKGEVERSIRLDYKVEQYEAEINGMEFVLRRFDLGVWRTKDDEWVIPDDDIKRAI